MRSVARSLNVKLLLSPPREERGAGVAILMKANELNPYLPQLWDSNVILGRATIKGAPLTVIAAYVPPRQRAHAEQKLQFITELVVR